MPATALPDPESFYRGAAAAAGAEETVSGRLLNRLSVSRLAAIVGALACWIASRRPGAQDNDLLSISAALLALAFVALVAIHRRAGRRHEHARARRRAAEAGLARVNREWDDMPRVRWLPPLTTGQQVLARDLGVTGDVSLHRLLDMTTPSLGSARAVQWLVSDPPSLDAIHARTASVAALRGRGELLLGFAAPGQAHRRVLQRGVASFTGWLGRDPAPADTRLPTMLVLVAAAAALALVAVLSMRPVPAGVATLLIGLQVAISVVARRHVTAELHGVGDALAQLEDAVGVMERTVHQPDVPGRFGEVQAELRRDGAVAALARLQRLLEWNNVRYTPLAHWLMNASVGLDVYIWRGTRAWRARHGGAAARWVDTAADAEALVALATLGFDHPAWTIADVHDDAASAPLDSTALGHPLLRRDLAVRNDLQLAQPGSVAVVSGSNMAGKTTYLRAAGLNTLLAQAGAPVCATTFRVRRCRVRTSVQIEDDLGSGISLFMAEAMRLRAIVGDAEAARGGAEPPVLFLLDEILHGTNAHDRREATRLVLRRLVAAGASGLVTTHDPSIAGPSDRQLHFRETLVPDGAGIRMEFDYIAREGPATTANALEVLRMLGLE